MDTQLPKDPKEQEVQAQEAKDLHKSDENRIEGEGSYTASKEFGDAQHDFAENGPVEEKAREAAEALDDEDESGELERAARAAAQGESI